MALKALALFLSPKAASAFDSYELRRHVLAPVIAATFGTVDDKIHADARALMNQMGTRGETDLDKRVAALVSDGTKD